MHICVHTFPFSTWSSTQVHIVNAPISWNQLIHQVLPYSFPLKMSYPFHSPPAVIPPGFQLDPRPLPTYPEIHPQYTAWAIALKMPFLHYYNPAQESIAPPTCRPHQVWIYSAWLFKQPAIWLHSPCETSWPTSSPCPTSTQVWPISASITLLNPTSALHSHHTSILGWIGFS